MKSMLLFLLLLSLSFAKSVTTSFTYTLGDRDTKIEAKKIAFAEAKRMAIENIGVWIKTETNIINGKLASDEINSFVMGYAKTKILSESFDYPKYTITIELTIDENEMKKNVPHDRSEPEEEIAAPEKKEVEPGIQKKRETSSYSLNKTEIGLLLGSGSLTIKEEGADDVKEGIGFGGLKANYYFTKNHAIEFIVGGGSTKVNEQDMQINTASLAYLYRFESVKDDSFFPFVAFGLVSGTAVLKSDSLEDVTYKGTGAMLHAGCKWAVSKDAHHIIEAGLLIQSFKDETLDSAIQPKVIEFGISELAFGYSYSF